MVFPVPVVVLVTLVAWSLLPRTRMSVTVCEIGILPKAGPVTPRTRQPQVEPHHFLHMTRRRQPSPKLRLPFAQKAPHERRLSSTGAAVPGSAGPSSWLDTASAL